MRLYIKLIANRILGWLIDHKWYKPKWIKFVDESPPVRRKRPQAVKKKYSCSECGRLFEAYPSELPQLGFSKFNDGVEPLVYCNGTRFNCPSRNKPYRTVNITDPKWRYIMDDFDWMLTLTDEDLEQALAE